jgi:uncharacterized protein
MPRPTPRLPPLVLTPLLIVLGAVLLGALLVAGLRWAEPHLIYFPTGPVTQTPALAGLAYQDVAIPTADGETLRAWWIPAARPEAPVLLFFHGNAGSREGRVHNLAGLHRAGLAVLIFDYRGYGGSSGTPSEAGLLRDGEAACDWLRRAAGGRPIVFFGRSLGGAVAARVALSRAPAGLILESTFTSAAEMARRVLPLPGIGRVIRSRYDVLGAVRRWQGPLLMIHGEADEVVPFAMGRRLFEAAASADKAFHAVPGGHHNDTYLLAGEAYWRWVAEFAARVGR